MNNAARSVKGLTTRRSGPSPKLPDSTGGGRPPVNVEVLPTPTKSVRDKKEYKVIRLSNGLTACLISDMASLVEPTDVAVSDSETESETDNEVESSSETATEEDDNDDRKRLNKNEKEVKLAAAALCIGVGSMSDPREIQGLAHFLEHMVFMGSTKYPEENDFDAFIKKHGGSDNASTDYECTTFYFECFEKHLSQALDKFSQFFISPLMKRDSMQRERQAIESEFQMAVPDDDHRKNQLLLSLSNEASPINKFSWGNLVTLQEQVTDDELYEKLHEFRKRHYSAHRMKVAIQARLPLSTLESYVVECFSDVPNNGLPPENYSPFMEGLFDTPQFKQIYYVKPMKDLCQVELTWALPPLLYLYKTKPQVYVSWLLGHEGRGSLFSYLKKKLWALSLYCENGDSDGEYNSLYSYVTVMIVLTKEGLLHVDEVIESVFSYIKMVNSVGPSERIFTELQLIEDTAFRFEEDESASDKVEELAECMHYYPPEHYLTGQELFFVYNSQMIEMVMKHLVPDRMNIMILKDKLPGIMFDQVEPWFKTQYAMRDIPESWMQRWLDVTPWDEFYLPEPNEFLTNDFTLLSMDSDIPEYPEKILDTPLIELWYRNDQKFKLPVAYYNYYFLTPLVKESVESAVMMEMLIIILALQLSEEVYPAALAELDYLITTTERGFYLKVNGYNEKLPVLLKIIIKHFKTVSKTVTKGLFEAVKDNQKKDYYNGYLKPKKLSKEVRLSVLQEVYFSQYDKYCAINNITLEKLCPFLDCLFESFYIQALVQGNLPRSVVVEVTNAMLDDLKCQPLPQNKIPRIRVAQLPKGERCLRLMSANEDNTNSIVTNYYQCGPISVQDNVILDFISLLIEEPLFDVLRTKEQLGYDVFATIRDTYGILGYSITVNTQANKHTTEHVNERIESFITHAQKIIKKLSEKKFGQIKQDLIKMKQFVDFDLEDEVQRNWAEIATRRYQFNRDKQEIAAIEQLKIGDIRQWWDDYVSCRNGKSCRKLSVQVVGHVKDADVEASIEMKSYINMLNRGLNANEVDSGEAIKNEMTEQISKQVCELKLLGSPLEAKTLNKGEEYFIRNIDEFKKTLVFDNDQ